MLDLWEECLTASYEKDYPAWHGYNACCQSKNQFSLRQRFQQFLKAFFTLNSESQNYFC